MTVIPIEEARLEDLVERSRRGDLEAFSGIVRRLHGEVRGFLAMMAVSPDWIDDVAQEVFIEVYRGLGRYESDRPLVKWVRGVARNVIRRHVERQSRESRLREDAVSQWLRRRQEERPTETDDAGSPLEALRKCLDRLPEHLRRPLHLQVADGMTSSAIAKIMERSADAIRMGLMRARGLLQDCVQSRLRGEGAGS